MEQFKRVKYACFTTNVAMSVVSNLSPILFLTFRTLYDISYSALGLLVLVNFLTQLTVDLIFSFFSHKFNIELAVKLTPVICFTGLVTYATLPMFFPSFAFVWLIIGTVIFSASGGLAEVLISPVIAAIPAKYPEREMSKLHSIYAWGVVGVIIVATFFILFFGAENWPWLALIFSIIPLFASFLFIGAKLPPLKTPEKASGVVKQLKNKTLWLCVFAIFLGGAAECIMAQWCSGYIEGALGIPKIYGDLFGVALFAIMLGLGRTLYAKFGKNISSILFLGAIGASVCYLLAAISPIPVIGLIACGLTGFCVSMMWPGSLVVSSDRIPDGGVFLFAMMASGGDLGAALGPQLVGIISDIVPNSTFADDLSIYLGISTEQLGLKVGMLVGLCFSIIAIIVFYNIKKNKQKDFTK